MSSPQDKEIKVSRTASRSVCLRGPVEQWIKHEATAEIVTVHSKLAQAMTYLDGIVRLEVDRGIDADTARFSGRPAATTFKAIDPLANLPAA